MRAAFHTLGCKVNQYETQVIQNQFALDGFDIVDIDDEADVYVINSCTVTDSGDQKVTRMIRRLRRKSESAIIALMGCFPQAFPEKMQALTQANVICGAQNRGGLLKLVKQALLTGERLVDISPHPKGEAFEPMKTDRFDEHTRAFVKIEDGCDRYCSYCIIPKARGPIRSKSLSDLEEELISLAQNGYKEVVLVGINLSSYGKETGYKHRLSDAVVLACSIKGIKRVRLGSLEPELLTDEDLDKLAAQESFCPQFHLSIQSGCDATLSRMNRHYTSQEYTKITQRIKKRFKNAAITTDIMVGFPGETQEEFLSSLSFAREAGFAKMHVFSYSVRAGTRAAEMENQVARTEKEKRCKAMLLVAEQAIKNFCDSQCSLVCNVLFEARLSDGRYCGYTENYTKVLVKSDKNLCGEILKTHLVKREREHCIGELC